MSEAVAWQSRIVRHAIVDLRTLEPHPVNPKIHTPEQDAVVRGSLRELGWVKSLTINDTTGHLLDGHERRALALEAGHYFGPAEYIVVDEAEEPKVLLLLDPSGQLYKTHLERWAQLAQRVRTTEPALAAFFAQQAAQRGVAGREGAAAPGAVSEELGAPELGRAEVLRQQWGVELGDVWALGAHRVYCGDCTTPAFWAWLTAEGGPVAGCITSPPYAEQRLQHYASVSSEDYVRWFAGIAAQLYAVLADAGSFFLNLKDHSVQFERAVYVHELVVALVRAGGWRYLDEFCWERPGIPGDPFMMGKFKNQWEPVFWFAKQAQPVFHPDRAMHASPKAFVDADWHHGVAQSAGTGQDMLGPDARRGAGWAYAGNRLPGFGSPAALGHAAGFPVGLPQFFVEVYSEPGEVWLDMFLGSGSTLMACEATGRRCVGCEVHPGYAAVTLQRWVDSGGEPPRRLEEGRKCG